MRSSQQINCDTNTTQDISCTRWIGVSVDSEWRRTCFEWFTGVFNSNKFVAKDEPVNILKHSR